MQQQERKEWISNLRVTATISVILLHVASTVLYQYNQVPNSEWWIGNIYDSLVRFSVPMFLMITGALILGKQTSYSIFLKKKVARILLPFAFWTAIYIVYNFIEPPQFNGKLEAQSNFEWILQQIKDGSSYHLWYIYMLLGIYISIPFLTKLVVSVRKIYLEFILIAWIIFISLSTPYNSESNFEWNLWYYFGYLGYVVLGYYLSITPTKHKLISVLAVFTFLTGLFVTVYGTYYNTDLGGGTFYKLYYSYLTPNVLLMTASLYVIFKNANNKLRGTFRYVRNLIDKYSYGIYLSHILVLNYLTMFKIDWYLFHPIIGIPLTTMITLGLSLTIVYLVNKIPYGKYISG